MKVSHLNPDGTPKYTNRLATETSPYLLQHAHNPVEWYPWGDEALERAGAGKQQVRGGVGGQAGGVWARGGRDAVAALLPGLRSRFDTSAGVSPSRPRDAA